MCSTGRNSRLKLEWVDGPRGPVVTDNKSNIRDLQRPHDLQTDGGPRHPKARKSVFWSNLGSLLRAAQFQDCGSPDSDVQSAESRVR